jgi:hypothetical protein
LINAEERTNQAKLPPVTELYRRWVRHTPALLQGPPDEQHTLPVGEPNQKLRGELVPTLTLGEVHQLQTTRGDKAVIPATNALVIGSINAADA